MTDSTDSTDSTGSAGSTDSTEVTGTGTNTMGFTGSGGEGAAAGARGASDGAPDAAPGEARVPGEPRPDDADFDVLRARLTAQAEELGRRTDRLNRRRVEVFGSTGLRLLGGARLRTAGDRVLRDLAWVGDALLAGGNPAPGTTGLSVVDGAFGLYRPDGGERTEFVGIPPEDGPGLLRDAAFQRDMTELFRYYRDAELRQLRVVDGLLLAVFQAGPRPGDVRVLRWRTSTGASPAYVDARGERDHVFPAPYDFAWTTASREDHRPGRHPHVSVDGEVFVSTVGGALRIRTVDDPETTEGTLHREPVDEPLQSLADAEIGYARVGTLILLRVLPYKETAWRHFVFTTTTGTVARLDGIGQGARRLPGDEGVVFPGGFHLGTGVHKEFDTDTDGLEFERVVRSPNGEDSLYVFHHRELGRDVLLSYNAIRKDIATPLTGRGFTLLDDGTLVVLRGDTEPKQAHPVQVWATPYASDAYAAAQPPAEGPLGRVGNADLVRGIADSLAVVRLVEEAGATTAAFEAVLAACTRVADRHHWLADPELGGLHEPLRGLGETAGHVLAAFTAVRDLTLAAGQAVGREAERVAALVRQARNTKPRGADAWIARLAELRRAQGRLAPLRDMRYTDTERIDALHGRLDDELTAAARHATASLSEPDAFAEQRAAVADLAGQAADIGTVADAGPVTDALDELAHGLRVVTETVGELDITDTTARTAILAQVADVQGELARARAVLTARRTALAEQEGRAESAAQFALLVQTLGASLAAADSPDACDDHLGRILLRIEDLAARFPELDDFQRELDGKRDGVQDAFAVRRQALVDERARHSARLTESAGRILDGLLRRASGCRDLADVDAFFAADPTVAKVHRAITELRGLGELVAAEELDGRLKATRQQAARVLRDRADLADGDGTTVRLGRHRFATSTQAVNLTLVPRDGRMAFALTGTDYRRTVDDPRLDAARHLWNRTLPSESPQVYRAEFLAARLLAEHGATALAASTDAALAALTREAAQAAYDEGYERGVHDHDAAAILAALLRLHAVAGLLRHPPADRATAQLLWAHGCDDATRREWGARARSLGRARAAFGSTSGLAALRDEIASVVAGFVDTAGGTDNADPNRAAAYLVEELALGDAGFVTSAGAHTLLDKFRHAAGGDAYDDVLPELRALSARRQLVEAWLGAYAESSGEPVPPGDLAEAVAIELCPDLPRYVHASDTRETVPGLLGTHPRVRDGRLPVRIDELPSRLAEFRAHDVPAFRAYQALRAELITAERARLRVDEHRPSVVTTFVRNRLIDRVYLPLIGDNLAKQLGAAGARKRTDNQGLLLLISPPGYGKTTLVDYVASRLGMLLVKVDGPALGHAVTSLDPAEAPNATARREIEKINFALEAGNNVMLYLDDIQHTSPELLQKFIPLCDAQRRITGVRDGEAHTHDLRGKRFAVVMAGNPYTEEGRRFRVPDMLANRADVWNLGDVLTGHQGVFALSFVENALTSNPVLAPLAERDAHDLDLLLDWAENPDEPVRPDRLTHPLPPAELDRVLGVLRNLLAARDTVLTVNTAYMASAAQTDESRTEPPFRLQGSYRNMNRIAERITPAMNDHELSALITDHYTAEAQTLAADTEANLLKLATLRGPLTDLQSTRWATLKRRLA
ncbi:DNA repair ATPase [Yinghuangia sp. ASG 101]|uniref:DNA repair ATPase n=1 Tax=Yinghuangia sp. ASG 101 TaxID=2896848 RepID=UPI001E616D41|nr:DNA repair ATPase [Yinghuangia sp. ASG 101]UGQ12724.1 DNA repair ATPase [Yinghuangia sp. ASG 101]